MNKRDELVGRLQQLLDAGDAIGGLSRSCADVVRASYDINTDVMYVAIADKPAVAKHGEFGLVLRYAPETEEPIGVTVIDFADMWGNRQQLRIPMVDVIAKHLKLPRQTVYEALRDNYHEPRGLSAAESPCAEGVNPSNPSQSNEEGT